MSAKLSQEHIAVIDQYLKNSLINYADIRMELVDHVAFEIEQILAQGENRKFNDVFKEYIGQNRLKLIDSNRRSVSELTWELLEKGLSKLCTIPSLIKIIVIACIYYIFIDVLGFLKTVWVHVGLNFAVILIPCFMYAYQRRKLRMPRLSSVERIGFILGLLVQLVFLVFHFKSLYTEAYHLPSALLLAVQLGVNIGFTTLGIEQFQTYKSIYLRKIS
jgi:hypothetical protein